MRATEVVWLLVLFDLPSVTESEKRGLTTYRKRLLQLGFTRLQWSVYARAYPRERACEPDRAKLLSLVPSRGRVRCIVVTDLQFEHMACVDGKLHVAPEAPLGEAVVL
jgi:CRISPR-associated protein Cas2